MICFLVVYILFLLWDLYVTVSAIVCVFLSLQWASCLVCSVWCIDSHWVPCIYVEWIAVTHACDCPVWGYLSSCIWSACQTDCHTVTPNYWLSVQSVFCSHACLCGLVEAAQGGCCGVKCAAAWRKPSGEGSSRRLIILARGSSESCFVTLLTSERRKIHCISMALEILVW